LIGETIENAGSTSETIEDDVGDAFCNRIDEFLRDRHLELRGGAVHESMMALRKTPGNGGVLVGIDDLAMARVVLTGPDRRVACTADE
jgi:hypothetical protein